MLLPRSSRDQLLTKVNTILQNLSDVVKVLSVCQVKESCQDCQCQEDVVSRLSSQDVEVSVKSAPANTQLFSLCSDDEMWWDQSDVSGQMSFDPNNNNLTVEAILDDSMLDDVKLFPSDISAFS